MIASKAAVLTKPGGDWEIHEISVEPPRAGEVLVKLAYAGLCYSDEHLRFGTWRAAADRRRARGRRGRRGGRPRRDYGAAGRSRGTDVRRDLRSLPLVLLGPVEPVRERRPGERRARWPTARSGSSGGPVGFPADGFGGFCGIGTFSQYAVVSQNAAIKVDPAIPLRAVALVSCGVLTGWGSVVHTADTKIGDTVVVIGAGGIGLNAVQGARLAGATTIIAVDPVESKRDAGHGARRDACAPRPPRRRASSRRRPTRCRAAPMP